MRSEQDERRNDPALVIGSTNSRLPEAEMAIWVDFVNAIGRLRCIGFAVPITVFGRAVCLLITALGTFSMRQIGRLWLGIAMWWLATLPTLAWDRGCDDSQPGFSEPGDSACFQFSDEGCSFAQDTSCLGQTLANGRYESLFWIGADSIWLTHSRSDFQSEILDPGNNAVVISQTLEHGLPVAPRVRIGSLLLDSFRTEVSYFGTGGWESSARIDNVAPLPDLDATIDYDAALHNAEWNFFSGQSDIDSHWMIGFRYLRYRDSFEENYRLDTGLGPLIEETARGEAENDAWGPQVGVGLDLGGGNTLITLGGKFGVMNNRVRQTGPSYANAILIDGNPETRFDNEGNEFAWLGELEVTLTHHLSRHCAFRLGYQGLFLDNVAQAARQNGRQADPSQISFHGAVLGMHWVR